MSEEITVDGPAEIANNNAPVQIPIVDFSAWKNKGDLSSRMQVAQEIVDACRKVGFVYIVNHAIPDSLIDEAFQWSKRFFALDDEDKMKAPHPDGWAVHRGYAWPDREKVSHITTEKDEDQRAKITAALEYKVSSHVIGIHHLSKHDIWFLYSIYHSRSMAFAFRVLAISPIPPL